MDAKTQDVLRQMFAVLNGLTWGDRDSSDRQRYRAAWETFEAAVKEPDSPGPKLWPDEDGKLLPWPEQVVCGRIHLVDGLRATIANIREACKACKPLDGFAAEKLGVFAEKADKERDEANNCLAAERNANVKLREAYAAAIKSVEKSLSDMIEARHVAKTLAAEFVGGLGYSSGTWDAVKKANSW
jgi:hypothetical protein